ncbi:MAG: peptidylprolyl isomerase [Sulfurifustaceae bacterium]
MKEWTTLALASLLTIVTTGTHADDKVTGNPKVRMTTTLGTIDIELDAQKAPLSTANFLRYVDRGFYNGTIFHRVIPGFMIQGGGFEPGLKQKPTDAPIKNEADNGLKNVTGTIAMARTSDPNSATAQFFINTVDNAFLDHREKTTQGWGYAVFGKVTQGLDVVNKIAAAPTKSAGPHRNVPVTDVVIQKVERLPAK